MLQEDQEDDAVQEQENQALDGAGTSAKQNSITGSRFFSVFELTPEGKQEKKRKRK